MSLAIVDRSDHLHQAVLHRDFDAEPAEFAAGLHLQVTQTTRIHVARMRIEPASMPLIADSTSFESSGFST
jgi:hypothetical protein